MDPFKPHLSLCGGFDVNWGSNQAKPIQTNPSTKSSAKPIQAAKPIQTNSNQLKPSQPEATSGHSSANATKALQLPALAAAEPRLTSRFGAVSSKWGVLGFLSVPLQPTLGADLRSTAKSRKTHFRGLNGNHHQAN